MAQVGKIARPRKRRAAAAESRHWLRDSQLENRCSKLCVRCRLTPPLHVSVHGLSPVGRRHTRRRRDCLHRRPRMHAPQPEDMPSHHKRFSLLQTSAAGRARKREPHGPLFGVAPAYRGRPRVLDTHRTPAVGARASSGGRPCAAETTPADATAAITQPHTCAARRRRGRRAARTARRGPTAARQPRRSATRPRPRGRVPRRAPAPTVSGPRR